MYHVPEPSGKWGKVAENTWPKDGSLGSALDGVPLSPTTHVYASRDGAFEWCSTQKVYQVCEVYARKVDGTRRSAVG